MNAAQFVAAQALSGPQAVVAMNEVRRARAKQTLWPFPWVEPPPGSKHVFCPGVIAAPLTGTQTLITSYQVPNTSRFCFHSVVLSYANVAGPAPFAPWVPGDGNVTFSLTVNNSTRATDAAQGRPYKDYQSILFPLGDAVYGAWLIDPGEESILESRNVLSAFVTVEPAIIQGGYFTAILKGWIWPNS